MELVIIDSISDLHGHLPQLEGGDLLIVAGDLTAKDRAHELMEFGDWVNKQDYKKKIVIAGNHDNLIAACRWNLCPPSDYGWDFEYLCDSGTEFEYNEIIRHDPSIGPCPMMDTIEKKKLKIYGSPWTLRFEGMNPHCMAFTCDTEEELAEKWALIPDDVDILVTHSPPHGILDTIGQEVMEYGIRDIHAGSKSLRDKVYGLRELKLHCFGHIHEAYNIMTSSIKTAPKEKIRHPTFVNASHVNENYEPVNKPIRIELEVTRIDP